MTSSYMEFLNSPTMYIVGLLALCALIFTAGLSVVFLVLRFAGRETRPPFRNVGYLSIAVGGCAVQLVTWALHVARIFSFPAVVISLAILVLAGLAFSRKYRTLFDLRKLRPDVAATVYVVGALAMIAAVGTDEYSLGNATSLYIQQGWVLFQGLSPDFFPNFGIPLIAPTLYTGHVISAVFGLLGHNRHLLYHLYGLYWVNVVLAPALPLGAYLLFRRFMSALPAVAAALAFCTLNLGPRVWSLRGESLGWVIGFAFILAVMDILDERNSGRPRNLDRLTPLLALLAFGAILTHAIFVISLFIVAVYAVTVVLGIKRNSTSRRIAIARFAFITSVLTALALFAFVHTYSVETWIESAHRPKAGTADAAVESNYSWDGLPLTEGAPLVKAAPPYASPAAIAQIVALIPPIYVFEPKGRQFALTSFPSRATDELASIPILVRLVLPALLILLGFLYVREPLWLPEEARSAYRLRRKIFCIAISAYLFFIFVAIFSDYRSVSLYPLAAVRRSFSYVAYFFWLAGFIGAADHLVLPILARVRHRVHLQGAFIRSLLRSTLLIPAIVGIWFLISVSGYYGRRSLPDIYYYDVARIASTLGGDQLKAASAKESLAPAFRAMRYLRAHTKPGDWVYSNVISSDNDFAYLTNGRFSLLEGSSVYQLFSFMKHASERIRSFRQFALSGDLSLLRPYHVRYILFMNRLTCRGIYCYGVIPFPPNMSIFRRNPAFERVLSDRYYSIYRITGAPEPPISKRISRLMDSCRSRALPAVRRIRDCTRLIALLGSRDSNAYFYRALSELQLGNVRTARSDFNTTIELNPTTGVAYYERAIIEMRLGDRKAAVADLNLAQLHGAYGIARTALRHMSRLSDTGSPPRT